MKVMARNYSQGGKWIAGIVEEVTGPVSYKVRIPGGVLRRHVDQLVPGSRAMEDESSVEQEDETPIIPVGELREPRRLSRRQPVEEERPAVMDTRDPSPPAVEEEVIQQNSTPHRQAPAAEAPVPEPQMEEVVQRTRSGRLTRKPAYLSDYC
jgi:hypothetical protein